MMKKFVLRNSGIANRVDDCDARACDVLVDLGAAAIMPAGAPIDIYRRNLQKVYIEALDNLVNPTLPIALPAGLPRGLVIFTGDIKNTDIPSIARAQLVELTPLC